MSSILGPYYSPTHWYPQDEEYMRRLDPAWVNIHQPSARAIQQVQDAAPNARIMLRSWDIDDKDGERKREMYADPKGAARKHLEMWKRKWDELVTEMHRNGWVADESRWYISLVNEPNPAFVRQVVEYSAEAMLIVRGTLIRLGLVASSVGTFKKPSEGDDGWTQFIPLEKQINDGGHILLAHEYWQPEGPSFGEDGGNLAWRHHIIPLDVPILIRESGANGYIYGRYSKEDDSGWQKTVKDPNVYAAQVKEYIEGCDTRVKGVLLYMLDFHDEQWWSFNTQPAMEQLLSIKDARPKVPSPFTKRPVETNLPSISKPEPQPAAALGYVTAPAGLWLRAAPTSSGAQIVAVPYGEQVRIVAVANQDGWVRAQWGNQEGWVASEYISLQPPIPTGEPVGEAPPAPVGDNWQRSIAWTLRWEGGLSVNPEDHGNWTGGRKGQGELKGTNFGISAASYPNLDIRNLTKEEAMAIYHRDYWQPSGAVALTWPFCLIVFDTAVLHGVGAAKAWLAEVGPNPFAFAAKRLRVYTKMDNWSAFGVAWVNRVADLLLEASKP